MQGWLPKLRAAVQLSILGAATVALFLISLVGSIMGEWGWRDLGVALSILPTCLQVPYSYVEPETHGHLWTGAHRLSGAVGHLQLANSYGLFRRMTGLGGRPEVVLEGSYDGHHWTVSFPQVGGLRGPVSLAQLTMGSPGRRSSSCTSLGM